MYCSEPAPLEQVDRTAGMDCRLGMDCRKSIARATFQIYLFPPPCFNGAGVSPAEAAASAAAAAAAAAAAGT